VCGVDQIKPCSFIDRETKGLLKCLACCCGKPNIGIRRFNKSEDWR
jgi:hypothetical protein